MKKYNDTALSPVERAEALCDELSTEQQAEQLRYDAPAIPQAGLPAYNWWNEGLHGVARAGTATVFPQAIGLAAAFDSDLIRRTAEIISAEARAKYNASQKQGDGDIYKGLTLWSPNINIFRDPRWGRGHETYGEDPYLTARLGVEFVKGLQGEGKHLRTAACAKHFAVHSGPEAIRHEFDAKASPKDMEETYLPAFKALVEEAKVEGVMGAYNRVNGEPACASEFLMGKLREWGFDGYFVSDCWAINDFHAHHKITETPEESAAMALKAGCDINCGSTYLKMMDALEKGLVTPEDIHRSCVRALRTRIRLGQLDKTEYDDIPYSVIACDEHKAVALEAAHKSAVLLKNNGILPLSREKTGTIAVIGPNADSRSALIGNYNGTPDRYITFLEGIQDSFGGRVIYAEGSHLFLDRSQGLAQAGDRLAEAVAAAENSDVIIACVGLDATLEGEEGDTGNQFASGDKNDLYLPLSQQLLLQKLRETGKPMIVVLAAGSSVNIDCDCDALLDMWYPGQYGGRALADIVFGDVSPSGKLPVTFYKDADKLPDFCDYSMAGRTYRYCNDDNVLYPFGFGLTYADIVCTDLSYNDGTVKLTVTNQSNTASEDVVQLYIKGYGEDDIPNHSLCGFARIRLAAHESRDIEIAIPCSAFETVNKCGVRSITGKRFTLYAGICQPDELSQKLSRTRCVKAEIIL
ncbi:MAG: glycoside hydrolase family 3 C-terminal domain-containing protein [Oscillospiraceae bacterium]|nr:glycoside hydrolase family 3 C-terminal domain-containing protein [Oscillospiraceae bacterium]